jgi:hypothetical protein
MFLGNLLKYHDMRGMAMGRIFIHYHRARFHRHYIKVEMQLIAERYGVSEAESIRWRQRYATQRTQQKDLQLYPSERQLSDGS